MQKNGKEVKIMKMKWYKAWLAAFFAAALLFTSGALAASCGLSSQKTDKGALITWNGSCCRSSCTLTLYRDGWPVKCASVSGAKGQCLIPSSYLKTKGTYTVRLKCGNACETITIGTVGKKADVSADVPSADETEQGSASVGTASSSEAAQVIRLVNEERAKQGLAPLTQSAELTRAACVRAEEIVSKFSHTRPDGTAWSTVSSAAYGENIAKGQRDAERVMAAWMSSSGHKANILRESYGSIGVCAYKVGGTIYWVQLFGR